MGMAGPWDPGRRPTGEELFGSKRPVEANKYDGTVTRKTWPSDIKSEGGATSDKTMTHLLPALPRGTQEGGAGLVRNREESERARKAYNISPMWVQHLPPPSCNVLM